MGGAQEFKGIVDNMLKPQTQTKNVKDRQTLGLTQGYSDFKSSGFVCTVGVQV